MFSNKAWLKAFSGLFLNLSAGWFGVAFVAPNLTGLDIFGSLLLLTKAALFGIVCLWLSVQLDTQTTL